MLDDAARERSRDRAAAFGVRRREDAEVELRHDDHVRKEPERRAAVAVAAESAGLDGLEESGIERADDPRRSRHRRAKRAGRFAAEYRDAVERAVAEEQQHVAS